MALVCDSDCRGIPATHWFLGVPQVRPQEHMEQALTVDGAGMGAAAGGGVVDSQKSKSSPWSHRKALLTKAASARGKG